MKRTSFLRLLSLRLLSLLLLSLLLLSGCELLPDGGAKPRGMTERSVWAMDTRMDLRLYGDAEGACMGKLTELLNGLDRELSATDPDSALSALNESGRTDNEKILYLTGRARELSAMTGGALDITLLPVSRAWGFTGDSKTVPEAAALEALRPRVGMDRVEVTENGVLLAEGTMLDFGALAKGWAAELCRAEMEAAGVSGILSLGGNIQTVGTKPDGSDWMIGVQDPDDPGRYVLTLRLTGSKAAVTSGDYQRYFEQDGVRYCHILDPGTLAPVRGSLRAVTVVADEGLTADGLSTALFVLGREAGEALRRELGGFETVWIEDDGTVWVSPGLKDAVTEGSFEVIEP